MEIRTSRLKTSTHARTRMIFSAGPHCGLGTCQKPASIKLVSTWMADQAGSDPDGIGTPGSRVTRSFRAGVSSTARLAGPFTPRLQFTGPRFSTEVITASAARIGSASTIILTDMASNRAADFTGQPADSTEAPRVAVSLAADSVALRAGAAAANFRSFGICPSAPDLIGNKSLGPRGGPRGDKHDLQPCAT